MGDLVDLMNKREEWDDDVEDHHATSDESESNPVLNAASIYPGTCFRITYHSSCDSLCLCLDVPSLSHASGTAQKSNKRAFAATTDVLMMEPSSASTAPTPPDLQNRIPTFEEAPLNTWAVKKHKPDMIALGASSSRT